MHFTYSQKACGKDKIYTAFSMDNSLIRVLEDGQWHSCLN
jgi:hypothetical protein